MPATLTYNAILSFPVADEAGLDVFAVGIYDAANGGTFYGYIDLSNNPAALAVDDRYRIPSGEISWTWDSSSVEFVSAWDTLVATLLEAHGVFYASLHSADPGVTGANEFDEVWYNRLQLINVNLAVT